MGKEVLINVGVPVHRVRGGDTDHPAESEIRELVRICNPERSIIALHLGCDCHKTNLLMVWMSKILCPGTERGVFSHKQTAFVFRYVTTHMIACMSIHLMHHITFTNIHVVHVFAFRYAATHMLAFSEFVEEFMGCKGWWCNVSKMQQEQR